MTDGRGNPGFKAYLTHRSGYADIYAAAPGGSGRRSQLRKGLKLAARFVYNPRLVVSPVSDHGPCRQSWAIDTAHLRCGDPRRNGFARPVIQYKQLRHAGTAIVASPPAH